MNKSLKIENDVLMYDSIHVLKDPPAIDIIVNKVHSILEKQGQKASTSSITKACRNAISRLWSKRKQKPPTFLAIYLPTNILQLMQDTLVPTISSDEEVTENSIDNDSIRYDTDTQSSSSVPSISHLAFSFCNDVLQVEASFEYLLDYFKHSLSKTTKPMNFEKIINHICTYVFTELKYSIDIRALKNEVSRQIGHIVQLARKRSAGRHILKTLSNSTVFYLVFKCISSLDQVQSMEGFSQFRKDTPLSPILLHRSFDRKHEILQFYPSSNTLDLMFSGL